MSVIHEATPARRLRILGIYVAMIVVSLLALAVIRSLGEAPTTAAPAPRAATEDVPIQHRSDALLHVLLALVVVVIAGQLAARLFAWFGQPPVIGEVIAGILLGPSLLGWLSPQAYEFLLPQESAPYLGIIAQFGVVLYMFVIGLELDVSVLHKHGHATVAISHASIVAPFVLGAAIALGLFADYAPAGVAFTPFALFLGAAMAVTAFPVLARILTDRGQSRTELGIIALACAATDDVTAWCLLALVVGVAQAQINGAALVIVMTLAYMLAMYFVVRPLLGQFLTAASPLSRPMLIFAFAGVLVSAFITEWIGIHAIFGAFLFGAIIPHDSRVARELPEKLSDLVAIVLLPAFFAFTGMRTQMGLISGWQDWLWCLAIIAVATLGKFGGSALAARFAGMKWRHAAALGILMNTRGLMELIVLNIGLDLGVISPRLFAMLVIMAIVTTMATTPLLALLGLEEKRRLAS